MTTGRGPAPARPRCEYLTNPLGIDVTRPRLSSTLDSARRAWRQSAYQILVAASEDSLRAGKGDLWDSGRVESGQSVHVDDAGPAPRSGQRCWWAVRVWDQDGAVSLYSAPAWWEMGLLDPTDWRGVWIGLDGASPAADPDLPGLAPSPYLRRTFAVTRPVRRARLYATARGLYEARLNGQRVGNALLAPGWTDYTARIQYQTYDVTGLLREGENALGAILGTGWYAGYLGFAGQYGLYGPRPHLLAQLHMEYDDGATETIASDGAWRAVTGPILYSDFLMGESYDARADLLAWDSPGYDDAAGASVAVADRGATPLVANRAEPVRVVGEVAPVAITRLDGGVAVVDMRQNMVGWARLRVTGATGTRVRLRFAEMRDAAGALYTENLRSARQTDTYILGGDGEDVFEPRFTVHGFRYVEVMGYPGDLTPDAITGRVVGSDTPAAGTFACSHELVNQLQRNIVWGQRGNFLSAPTDCPQRDERLGWMGDAQIFARTASYNADVAAFFTIWLTDVVDAQAPDGAFPDIAPLLVLQGTDLSHGALARGDAGVIVPWTLYQVYGDTRVLVLQRYLSPEAVLTTWKQACNRSV